MIAATDFNSTANALLIVGGCVGVIFAVVLAVRFAASFPALPSPGPETQDLGGEPPAVVNLLVNRCSATGAAEAATLVDLAARRYVELFEAGPDRFVVRVRPEPPEGLTPYEQQILDLVHAKATGGSAPLEAILLDDTDAASWRARFQKTVLRDAKARGLLRGRWSRLDWTLFATLAGGALLLIAAGLYAAHVEQTAQVASSHSTSGRFSRDDWWWVAFGAWVVVLGIIGAFRSVRYSETGAAAASRWLGVRRFLRRDPAFADAPPAAVAIWGRLLSYGAALGVARATSAAIPLAVEGRETAWSRYGGDWHQVHIEYPRHFGYGQRPLAVFLGGLVRTLFWGALVFGALPAVVDALWKVGNDALKESALTDTTTTALVGMFFVVFGIIAVSLLLRFADGLVRLWLSARDLGRPHVVEGEVVKVVNSGAWFAVDPGHVDHVKAWHSGELPLPTRYAVVRVTVTPHLRHVSEIDVVQDRQSPSTSGSVADTPTAAQAQPTTPGPILPDADPR